jgi:chemotaxis signal transduction protein
MTVKIKMFVLVVAAPLTQVPMMPEHVGGVIDLAGRFGRAASGA